MYTHTLLLCIGKRRSWWNTRHLAGWIVAFLFYCRITNDVIKLMISSLLHVVSEMPRYVTAIFIQWRWFCRQSASWNLISRILFLARWGYFIQIITSFRQQIFTLSGETCPNQKKFTSFLEFFYKLHLTR